MADGFVDDLAVNLAAAYIAITQKNVFEPVGVDGVHAKPPITEPQDTGYAFSYKYLGIASGYNWLVPLHRRYRQGLV
jgi:hypothetical protein